ncbi:MAG: hypothetical protein ACI9OF_001477, partial [Saprospiraceae bacterium]
ATHETGFFGLIRQQGKPRGPNGTADPHHDGDLVPESTHVLSAP